MRTVDGLLDLVLPSPCLRCGDPVGPLCAGCLPDDAAFPVRIPGMPLCWAAGAYADGLRTAVLAYKERRHRALAGLLGAMLAAATVPAVGDRHRGPVLLVPVPAAAAAVRARGYDHVGGLARVAARALRSRGRVVRVAPLLGLTRRPTDSLGLSASQRQANLAGAFRVRSLAPLPVPATAVLVDDVVTTGATLTEAARALAVAGLPARVAAVVAATPRWRP